MVSSRSKAYGEMSIGAAYPDSRAFDGPYVGLLDVDMGRFPLAPELELRFPGGNMFKGLGWHCRLQTGDPLLAVGNVTGGAASVVV